MWNIKYGINYLLGIREQIGSAYGSEELCVLLYSMVKREKPITVVELGTGLGVTTAWIAAALQENGMGTIWTIDDGSHFATESIRKRLANLSGDLYDLARLSEDGDYEKCLNWIFEQVDVADYVRFFKKKINVDAGPRDFMDDVSRIDMLFSDFNHSPGTIVGLLGAYLPHMNDNASIFFDSASTYLPSFWMLGQLIDLLNRGGMPVSWLKYFDDTHCKRLRDIIGKSRFQLVHLVERIARDQNSTAWIRVFPRDIMPPNALTTRL